MKTNKLFYSINPDRKPLLFYFILLFVFVYSFFHFALLPYMTKSEVNYWYNYFSNINSVSGFNLTNLSTDEIWGPLLYWSDVDMIPLRLIYSFTALMIILGMYWKSFLYIQRTFRERFIFCLIISTTPILILQRGLPAGFINLFNLLIFVNLLYWLISIFHPGHKKTLITYISVLLLSILNGFIIPLILLLFTWFVYKNKKEKTQEIFQLAYISILSLILLKFILNFQFSNSFDEKLFVLNPKMSIYQLFSNVGIYLPIAFALAFLKLFKSYENTKPEIFILSRLWTLFTLILIFVPSAISVTIGIYIILTASIITQGLDEVLNQNPFQNKITRSITTCLLVLLFIVYPFSTSIKINSSFLDNLSASIIENKSILSLEKNFSKDNQVRIFGKPYDSTSTILISLASIKYGPPLDKLNTADSNIIYLTNRNLIPNLKVTQLAIKGDLILFKPEISSIIVKKRAETIEDAKILLNNQITIIKNNSEWLNAIRTKCEKTGISFQKQIIDDAIWSLITDSLISIELSTKL